MSAGGGDVIVVHVALHEAEWRGVESIGGKKEGRMIDGLP